MSEIAGSPAGPRPLILNLAPTGMVPTRQMSAAVPLTPAQIIHDVVDAASIGISSVHLHVRDEDGRPSFSKELFARVIGGIREQCEDLVICVSCSGRGGATLEQRSEVLTLTGDLKPDMASLTLSSLNFPSEASTNEPSVVLGLAERMMGAGIVPELEIFDVGMANYAAYMARRGLLPPALYANLLFGNIATAQARLLDIAAVVAALPPAVTYSVAGLGASQLSIVAIGAATADGVRIGLEDNLWYDAARTEPATNGGLVERVHRLAGAVGRPIMPPSDLRQMLRL